MFLDLVLFFNTGADMRGLQIGLSALRASQIGIDVSAQNIANASTPGYHRRDVQLGERTLGAVDSYGTGVDIDEIRRVRSSVTEGLLTTNISLTAFSEAKMESLDRVETLLTPTEGSIHDRLQAFFGSMQELSSRSGDTTLQRLVVEQGSQLASQVQAVSSDVRQLGAELDLEIQAVLEEVNNLTQEVSVLQERMLRKVHTDESTNALRDQFDRVVNQLAEYIDIQPDLLNNNHTISRFATGAAVIGHEAPTLLFDVKDGNAVVTREGNDKALNFSGGKLGGLLAARNDLVSGVRGDLDQFAKDLIVAVDSVHSRGIGSFGAFEILSGTRGIPNPDEALTSAADFPIEDGSLYVRVTDTASGESTLNRIDIDANTDTLSDLAGKIAAVGGIDSFVRPESGKLAIAASPGFTFDFTGQVGTQPTTSSITGTSQLTLSGSYAGEQNDTFTLTASETGTVGLTEDLFVDVRDGSGNLVRRLNVGNGYEPGSQVEIDDGLFATFSAGTLNTGDTAASEVVSEPDTSGALVALGLNSFFTGRGATDISVNEDLQANPERFADSLSGASSDSRNLTRLLKTRDAFAALDGTRTLEQSVADLTSFIGSEVASNRLALDGLAITEQQLESQRDSVSGVDPNEELVKMMTFQRAFQAASRVISTIETVYDDLFRIV
ncbi:MAG: flagellar hook-associated protein FlgK [Planctomycetaceae bacterium]